MAQKAEDIIMKNVFDLLKGDALKFFGIDKRIVAPARTELNFIKIQTNFDDNTYLLEDDTFIHFEYQTTNKNDDIYRFMASDAVLAFKEKKPVRTLVIYSADIVDAHTYLDMGSIKYEVDAFYMVAFDGDVIYNEVVEKVNRHEKLSKQDLMSIVLLPIMKSKGDKLTRIKNCIELSKKIDNTTELMQIQAMLYLMAEKFVADKTDLEKVKEMIDMSILAEMIIKDDRIKTAKKALQRGLSIEFVVDITDLDEETVKQLQDELNSN